MKNLKYYEDDCFTVYENAVKSKRDENTKRTLVTISDRVKLQFDFYSENFQTKTICDVVAEDFSEAEKSSLISLYRYRSSIIKKIKNKILDSQIRTINTTCQYCTLNSVNTLDHFIPKEEFPEFSVYALNLFPCCPECNSKKSNISYIGKESQFLNLYLDELPEVRYLKAEFDFADDVPLVTFSLLKPSNIDNSLYNTITNHYERLNLFERMREKSNETITEIIESIKTYYRLNNDINYLILSINEEEQKNKEAYGFNYWKSELRLSLIAYNEFWEKYIL